MLASFQIPYADGRRQQVQLVDQVVPGYCVRRRDSGTDGAVVAGSEPNSHTV